MTANEPDDVHKSVPLRVKLPQRAGTKAEFANHGVATFMGDTVVITFGQVLPPSSEDKDEFQEAIARGYLDAHQVAQVVMPVGKFVEWVDSLSALVERLRERGAIAAKRESVDAG